MKVRCPACDGLGTLGPFPPLRCALCQGWGRIKLKVAPPPAPAPEEPVQRQEAPAL